MAVYEIRVETKDESGTLRFFINANNSTEAVNHVMSVADLQEFYKLEVKEITNGKIIFAS